MIRTAICAGLAIALLGAADSAAAPALRLMRTNPVEVRASGFHAREAVRLTVRSGANVTRSSTRADGSGHFTATVKGAVAVSCESLTVVASGADGSRAVYRRLPLCATHGGAPSTSARS